MTSRRKPASEAERPWPRPPKGEGAPGAHRSGSDGLQGRAGGRPGRPAGRGRVPAQEGAGRRGQEVAPRGARRGGGVVHPPRGQDRRAGRGQLRDRLRGPHRRLPAAREGRGDAGGRRQSVLRRPRGGAGGGGREGARDLPAADGRPEEAAPGRSTRSSRASSRSSSPSPACWSSRSSGTPPGRPGSRTWWTRRPRRWASGSWSSASPGSRSARARATHGRAAGAAPAYRRVLLKLSGEALAGGQGYGIDPDVLGRIAEEIREVRPAGRAARGRHRGRQHLPRHRGQRGRAWTAPPATTWACWPP